MPVSRMPQYQTATSSRIVAEVQLLRWQVHRVSITGGATLQ